MVLLNRDSNIRQLADRVFIEQRIEVRPVFEVSYINTAVALARAGFGVTIVPKLEAHFFNRGGLRPLLLTEPAVRREISVLMRRNLTITPYVRDFIAVLRRMQQRTTANFAK